MAEMKTIARLLAGALAMFFTMAIAIPVAAACDCDSMTLQEQVDSADVVARVVVEASKVVDHEEGGEKVVLTMRPTHVWKGDVVSKFTVMTAVDESECGLGTFEDGTDLLLFAEELEGKYSADRCGGTTGANASAIAALNEVAGPGETIDPVAGDEPGAFVWPTITAIAAVVLVAGVIIVWWILPRHRR